MTNITDPARVAAAKALGYKDWGDATDYRLTGAQDKAVKDMAHAFQRAIDAAEAPLLARLAEAERENAELKAERDGLATLHEKACMEVGDLSHRAIAAETKLAEAVEVLKKIAARSRDEGGCYYNNRLSIDDARTFISQHGGGE